MPFSPTASRLLVDALDHTLTQDSPFLRDDSAFVFTTEGHPLEIPHLSSTASRRSRSRGKRAPPSPTSSSSSSSGPSSAPSSPGTDVNTAAPAAAPTCASHDPLADERHAHFLALGMDRRTDWEHARWLAGQVPSAEQEERLVQDGTWRAEGWCEMPQGEVRRALSQFLSIPAREGKERTADRS